MISRTVRRRPARSRSPGRRTEIEASAPTSTPSYRETTADRARDHSAPHELGPGAPPEPDLREHQRHPRVDVGSPDGKTHEPRRDDQQAQAGSDDERSDPKRQVDLVPAIPAETRSLGIRPARPSKRRRPAPGRAARSSSGNRLATPDDPNALESSVPVHRGELVRHMSGNAALWEQRAARSVDTAGQLPRRHHGRSGARVMPALALIGAPGSARTGRGHPGPTPDGVS